MPHTLSSSWTSVASRGHLAGEDIPLKQRRESMPNEVPTLSATRKLFEGRSVGGPICSVIASKPDYLDGLRRRNGFNLWDSVLYARFHNARIAKEGENGEVR